MSDAGATEPDSNEGRFQHYFYPGTTVLRNWFDIRDQNVLSNAEFSMTTHRAITLPSVPFTVDGFKAVHQHLFQDLYPWAGEFRKANMSLGGMVEFAPWWTLEDSAHRIFAAFNRHNREIPPTTIEDVGIRASRMVGALNRMHPFREGNGRTMRSFLSSWTMEQGYRVDFEYFPHDEWVDASAKAYHQNYEPMEELIGSQHGVALRREADEQAEDRIRRMRNRGKDRQRGNGRDGRHRSVGSDETDPSGPGTGPDLSD